jgi:transglutaminase-like putative cysteine protease
MNYLGQLPRNALVWIVLSQFALLVPHLGRIPIWVSLVYLLAAFWRLMVYRGQWSFPQGWLKGLLTVTCLAGTYLSYGSLLELEPLVALLLTAYALKLIELQARKDAYLLIFLGYFVVITEFLFSQDIAVVIYMALVVVVITTALVALHQPGQNDFSYGSLRRSCVLLAQAFPLMLVSFVVFPRFDPLWVMPIKGHQAKSGVSDFMSPGDISELSFSDDVAFRVQFDGEIPKRSELYWRGLVFSKLDDGVWRSLAWRDIPPGERRQSAPDRLKGRFTEYEVIMEPTQQKWLYALRYPRDRELGVVDTNDFLLASPIEVQDQLQYSVVSWLDVPLEKELSDWRREVETALPARGNPRARALAKQMYAEQGGDPRQFVNAVLSKFAREEYFYTLKPPLLGDDDMDEFLFESRRGFCEHYAAAFVYLMRAAGVPARVVAGYQGGEVSPVNGTVIVHQFDAHAWAEIWLEGRGWERVDPTATIAPERIEWGLEFTVAEEGTFLANSPLSPLRYRNIAWINQARLQLDAMSYRWQRFVLEFDGDTQYDLLDTMLGEVSPGRIMTFMGTVWGLVLIPVAVLLLRRRAATHLDPATRIYHDFCQKLSRVQLERGAAEAPGDYAQRVVEARPDLSGEVRSINRLYERASYLGQDHEVVINLLRSQVRKFKPARVA